jgi:small neutral amino acid transporter SnatA (MarC family)
VGLRRLILPPSELVVPLPGRAAWVVPGAFPLLLTPEVTALLVLFGATEPSALLITALAVGLGLVVAAAWIPAAPRRWEAAIVRSSGLLLVAFGIALVVEGIRDV